MGKSYFICTKLSLCSPCNIQNMFLHFFTQSSPVIWHLGRRTFVHRAFIQDWHFIAVCQVNMHFLDFIFPSLCSRLYGLFGHIWFVVFFFYWIFLLGRLTLQSCILTCNPTFYYFKNNKLDFFFIQHLSKFKPYIFTQKVYIIIIFIANIALIILGLDKSPFDKCPTTDICPCYKNNQILASIWFCN